MSCEVASFGCFNRLIIFLVQKTEPEDYFPCEQANSILNLASFFLELASYTSMYPDSNKKRKLYAPYFNSTITLLLG